MLKDECVPENPVLRYRCLLSRFALSCLFRIHSYVLRHYPSLLFGSSISGVIYVTIPHFFILLFFVSHERSQHFILFSLFRVGCVGSLEVMYIKELSINLDIILELKVLARSLSVGVSYLLFEATSCEKIRPEKGREWVLAKKHQLFTDIFPGGGHINWQKVDFHCSRWCWPHQGIVVLWLGTAFFIFALFTSVRCDPSHLFVCCQHPAYYLRLRVSRTSTNSKIKIDGR